MKENEANHHGLKKLLERLIIILDINIPNGIPLIETDRDILQALYPLIYNGSLEWLTKEPLVQDEIVQTELFKPMKFTDEKTDST